MFEARAAGRQQLRQAGDVGFNRLTLREVEFAKAATAQVRRSPAAGDETDDIGHGIERRVVAILDRGMKQVGDPVQFVALDPQFRCVDVPRDHPLAGLERTTDLLQDLPLVGVTRVKFKTKMPEPALPQPIKNHIQGGHLLGHEKDFLTVMGGGRNDVRDGLRLAGSRWALNHQVPPAPDLLDDFRLRGVRLDDLHDILGRK